MSPKTNDFLVFNDTTWFDKEPEKYLERDDFRRFSRIAGVELRDLASDDSHKVRLAQEKVVRQSVVFNEIQRLHFGYGFPLLVYTHDLELFEKVPNHNRELDELTLGLDMCDSLRRRHLSLSHAILPQVVEELHQELGHPVVVKNLGSGVGLDSLHLLQHEAGKVLSILNYDTDSEAIGLGRKITGYLESRKSIEKGVVRYIRKSLTKSFEPADMIVKVGVICGIKNPVARTLIASDYEALKRGGKLVVTSSNQEMRKTDPLGNFMIQHIGSCEDPQKGWGLNFRTKETLSKLLTDIGFSDVQIYDDSNYPGKENLPDEILYGCDTLPARALGHGHSGKPLSLPPKETLDMNIGYNWIAIATKGTET